MKNKFIRLAIACLLCAAALLSHHIINDKSSSKKKDFNNTTLQNTFSKHEQKMKQNLTILLDKIPNPHDTSALSTLNSIAQNDNYSYYIFDKNELTIWHNAIAPINDITPDKLSQKILDIANGWYFTQKISHNNITAFALFRIKSKYLYNNEYLNTKFDQTFDISERNKIVINSKQEGYKIFDTNNNYLFTITNNDHSFITDAMLNFDFALLLIWLLSTIYIIFEITTLLSRNNSITKSCVFLFISLLGLYIWALNISISSQMSTFFIFSSQVFAYDWWMPSLAFIFIASLCIVIYAYFLYNHINLTNIFKNNKIEIKFLISIFILFALYSAINRCINNLIYHSTDLIIYVNDLDISGPTLVKIAILSFLTLTLLFIFDNVYKVVAKAITTSQFYICIALFSLIILMPIYLILNEIPITIFIGFIVFNILFFYVRRKEQEKIKFNIFIWIMFLSTLYIMIRLTELNIDKEHTNRELLTDNIAIQLIREDDPVAESTLINIEEKLNTDTIIPQKISDDNNFDSLYHYLCDNYFNGYLSRFNLQVIPCQDKNSKIRITISSEEYNCFDYFTELIETFGSKISPNSKFYCLNDNDGRASYFGKFTIYTNNNDSTNLYIELDSKPYSNEFGYPELLTNSRDRINLEQLKRYSYAKYFDGNISISYGSYKYPQKQIWLGEIQKGEHKNIITEGFSHTIYAALPDQIIVLSYPIISIAQFATDYSFLFLSMLIICVATIYFLGRKHNKFFSITSIQERIQSAFIILILTLLTIFCAISGVRSTQRFELDSQKRMTQLVNAIKKLITLETDNNSSLNINDIDNILQRANDLFSIDAHFYSPQGNLIGTSRHELFFNGVTSQLINSKALIELRNNHNANNVFINENIGQLTYFSIYSRLYDYDGQLIGYINIPYFTDINATRNQLLSTFIPITNSFMIIILLAILFSHFVAHSITKPLLHLSSHIRKVGLQKNNEKITYPNKDEIGILVNEYNRMLDELAYSAEKLAANERELTWREMARQIAHEIKNPLTPMKLSVQYLIKAWDSKRDDFDTFIHKVANTLTEQIDQLSYIASQFSNLAKMQNNVPLSPVDIVERLSNTITLFERTENAEITLTKYTESAIVSANADQMTSVFNNLIKNAIQATKNDETIKIHASISIVNDKVHIAITDNGNGIPTDIQEKIFKPNFTTKSTGMGLGLAIVKNIIINSHGEIWFETEVGQGTTFFIELPLIN